MLYPCKLLWVGEYCSVALRRLKVADENISSFSRVEE
jgi:hypothetical protein